MKDFVVLYAALFSLCVCVCACVCARVCALYMLHGVVCRVTYVICSDALIYIYFSVMRFERWKAQYKFPLLLLLFRKVLLKSNK